MKPLKRSTVNKSAAAGNFRRQVSRTKALNVAPNPNRGGYRL